MPLAQEETLVSILYLVLWVNRLGGLTLRPLAVRLKLPGQRLEPLVVDALQALWSTWCCILLLILRQTS